MNKYLHQTLSHKLKYSISTLTMAHSNQNLFFFSCFAVPIGHMFNLNEKKPLKPFHSTMLDEAYKKYGKSTPKHKILLVGYWQL